MTEPLLTGGELRPLIELVFGKRLRIAAVFLIATIGMYVFLRVIDFASYEASSVAMVKTPMVDFDGRIDPNPQVAPAYLDLAISDGLLADTHDLLVEMRELAEPIRQEVGFEGEIDFHLRQDWILKLRQNEELAARLSAAAENLELDWQKEIFRDPVMFLGLFEIGSKDIHSFDLFKFQETFRIKAGIAAQTNVYILSEPFINLSVTWGSPGAAALLANLWGHLFVDRANELTKQTGETTEESILGEAAKLEEQLSGLKTRLTEMRGQPEYQKLQKIRSLENALYGGEARIDMFGYVEFHANFSQESGLIGKLSEAKMEMAQAIGETQSVKTLLAELSAASEEVRLELMEKGRWANLRAAETIGKVEGMEDQVEAMSQEIQELRQGIAEFESEYRDVEFKIEQGNRIFSEKLTTSIFSRSRLKAGYAIPPMVFVERAIPSKQRAGMSRLVLALAVGCFVTLVSLCWIVYRGYLIPAFGTSKPNTS
jgi:hypothetical protein